MGEIDIDLKFKDIALHARGQSVYLRLRCTGDRGGRYRIAAIEIATKGSRPGEWSWARQVLAATPLTGATASLSETPSAGLNDMVEVTNRPWCRRRAGYCRP
jgi:hypothetical protein